MLPREPPRQGAGRADNPSTSSDNEPSDIDIGAAREAFTERISDFMNAGYESEIKTVDRVLIYAVTELYRLLEHETRRIDNELTQTVTDSGNP